MGATFCNLFVPDAYTEQLKKMVSPDDGIRTGYDGWTMVMASDQDPRPMVRIARKLACCALVFYYFDDDLFELELYQEGKKAASLNSGGQLQKGAAFQTLLPDDPQALKRLRLIGRCATMDEKLYLLEETFGLPFYAMVEEENVPKVQKSDATYQKVKMRMKALKNRPNRFSLTPLEKDAWPVSAKAKWELICLLREKQFRFLSDLVYGIPLPQSKTQPGQPGLVLFPTYICDKNERNSITYGSNTVLIYEIGRGLTDVFSFPIPVGQVVMLNQAGGLICQSDHLDCFACLDRKGQEQWRFAPLPHRAHMALSFANVEQGELLVYEYYGSSAWIISPEDGRVLAERTTEGDDKIGLPVWVPSVHAFVYYSIEQKAMVLLDRRLEEIGRWNLGEDAPRFDGGFFRDGIAYTNKPQRDGTWKLASLNLVTGEQSIITPEIPSFINKCLPGNVFCGETEESGNPLILFDNEGKVISRHHFKDRFMGVWEEDGRIYAATIHSSDAPGFWEDAMTDTVQLFRLDETTDE